MIFERSLSNTGPALAVGISAGRRAREAEGASLGVTADRPPVSRVDDFAAELDHPRERGREICDAEVGKRDAIAGAAAARMSIDDLLTAPSQ